MSAGWKTLDTRPRKIKLLDYGPIGLRRRPGRPLKSLQTDIIVRPKQVIYWPNLVTRRRGRLGVAPRMDEERLRL